MLSEAVRRQIALGEGVATEFVVDVEHYAVISRAVCAFLNGGGGSVLCGLDDAGRVVGVDGDPEVVRERLETRLNRDISPAAPFTAAVEREDGLSIIVIEVPAGSDLPYVVSGAVYLRSGARSRAATATQLRAMIQTRAATPDRWERRPAAGLEADDLDLEEVRVLVSDARRSGRFVFRDPDDDLAVLGELGMYGSMGLTQGADVAFAVDPARRHPQVRARVIKFSSDKTGDIYDTDEWFAGPVAQVIEGCVAAVSANVRLQSRFRPGDIRRENQPEYSLQALREGIVNAFAHRDYAAFSGGVVVSIFPGRIEIWNSGRLPDELSTSDLRRNHHSIPANPDIVHVLYLRNLMERTGRGTQMIIQECRLRGAPPPKWQDRPSGVTLTLYASPARGAAFIALNARQEALLAQLGEGERITPAEYRARFAHDVSERHARRDLIDLEEAGLVERVGAGPATEYLRTDRDWPSNRT